MTDEQMDARLRGAGERWRSANTVTAAVESAAVAQDSPEIVPAAKPKRHWALLASAAVVAGALVTGGALVLHGSDTPAPSGDTAALEGHVWSMVDSRGRTTLYVGRDGKLVADDDCRIIGGTVTLDGTSMTVSDQIVRYKSCTDQYGPGYYEQGTAVLDGTSTVDITTDGMTISKDGESLHFALASGTIPQPTLDFPTMTGTPWKLVSAKDTDGNDVPVAGDPTLTIGDDGKLAATDGCNTLSGDAVVAGAGLRFSNVGGTEIGCTGDRATTAAVVDAMLTGDVQAIAVGGELTLTKDDSELLYRWEPDASDANDPAQVTDGTWTLLDSATYDIPANSTLDVNGWAVERGSLVAAGTSAIAQLLNDNRHVWTVADGRLLIYVDDVQGSALVFTQGTPTPPPTSNANLLGAWHLATITFGDGRYRNGAPATSAATLAMTDTGYSTKNVCYTVEGDLAHDDTSLTFTGGHTTDVVPCPLQAGQSVTSQAVDAVLSGPTSWSIDAGILTVTNGDSHLTFATTENSLSPAPIEGTDWTLETAVADSGMEYPADGQSLGVGGGEFTAVDGVNTLNGSAVVKPSALVLDDVSTTAIGSTANDPVTAIVDELIVKGQLPYVVHGDELVLTQGGAQLIYRAAGSDSVGDTIDGSWDLTTIEDGTGPDGSASNASATGPLVIDSAHGSVRFGDCNSASAVAGMSITFSDWLDTELSDCTGGLDATQGDFVFGKILTGECTWTRDDSTLTITKDGVGAIVLTNN